MQLNNAHSHYDQLQHRRFGGHDRFLISKEELAELVEINPRNPLQKYDGLAKIVSALETNIDAGITGDEIDLYLRRKAFGSNWSPPRPPQRPQITSRLKRLFLDAFSDITIILLLCTAALSIAIEIKTNGEAEGVFDGALVLVAVSFVLTFGAIFRFFKARWVKRKSSVKKDTPIRVVRNGEFRQVPESELVVGDIICLQAGDHVVVDGIFLDGDYDGSEKNYLIFTGAKVARGNCRMLVISVGENTERNRLIRSIAIQKNDESDQKLGLLDAIDEHNSKLEKIWLSLSLILLVVQLVRCFVKKTVETDKDVKGVNNTMEDLMNEFIKLMKERSKASGFITMLCVLLFACRNGLQLAIFTSLLYASKKMKSCKAVIRIPQASATVGLVTTVCCGKTADLILNYKKMAELWIGFNRVDDLHGQLDVKVLDALSRGIFADCQGHNGVDEISLIAWARTVLGLDMECFNGDCSFIRCEESHIDENVICSIMNEDNGNSGGEDKVLHVYYKGEPQLILSMCSHFYTVDGKTETIFDNQRTAFLQIVHHLISCSRSCFAFAYKQKSDDDKYEAEGLQRDLVLIGFVGLKNPYSCEVREVIQDFRRSGIRIKFMVDEDMNTARIMAVNSGILTNEADTEIGSSIVEAANFRSISEQDRMSMIDNIHVVANASPADKLLMVQCLRQKGEIVAASASTIRDSPVLKEADVGIFMGYDCGDLFKEDSDILVQNKNLSQIPDIIKLGRRVCKNLEKFMQLQVTLEISAFTISIIYAAADSKEEIMSSLQVLWVNLTMETLGALAMAIATVHTQFSHTEGENPKQIYGSGAVITGKMWSTIAVQSFFQVAVILILGMKGKAIFQVKESILKTMVFNCYAMCQLFLLIVTAIGLKRKDVVAGLSAGKSYLFLGTVAIIGILQAALVELMRVVANCSALDIKQWCICIGIASLSVPLSWAAIWIPSTWKFVLPPCKLYIIMQ